MLLNIMIFEITLICDSSRHNAIVRNKRGARENDYVSSREMWIIIRSLYNHPWKISARNAAGDSLLSLVKQNTFVHRLATYWTLRHPVATHLTGAMSTQEDHVFQTI